ncbi:MAG TPA: VOC family protein [Steroidobacteraceae bacterium]|nr:VOC family protein [Steroidobacteraceae bacterium]
MIAYVTIGTNDLGRAASFYDRLLAVLHARRVWELERSIGWSTAPGAPTVSVIKPYDALPATVGNGVMVALAAKSEAEVDAVYQKALELGGKDEGAAGPRVGGYYAAYFRDLDGNKLCAFYEK